MIEIATEADQIALFQKERDEVTKEKILIEKELKAAQAIIAKSKEARVVQMFLDDLTKLRNEIDLLGDLKMQNDSLKEGVLSLIAKSDAEKASLTRKIAALKNQLVASNQTPNEETTDTTSAASNEELAAHAARYLILESKCIALEKSQAEWKTEKSKMQKVVGNLKVEIEDLKVKAEEGRSSDLSVSQASLGKPTAANTSSWFTAVATAKVSTSVIADNGLQNKAEGSTQGIQQQSNLAVPVQNTAKSWWTRSVSPSTQVTAATTDPSTNATTPPSASSSLSAAPIFSTPIPPSVSTSSSVSLSTHPSQPQDSDKVKILELEIQSLKKVLEEKSHPLLPLKTAEFDKLNFDLVKQTALNKEVNSQVKALEVELAESNSIAQAFSSQVQELQTAIINSNLRALKEEEKIKVLTLRVDCLSNELSLKVEDVKALDLKKTEIEQQLYQLQASIEISSKEKGELCLKIEGLIRDIENKTEMNNEFELKIQTLEKELQSKSDALITITSDLKILETRMMAMTPTGAAGTEGIEYSNLMNTLQEELKKQLDQVKADNIIFLQRKQEHIDSLKGQLANTEKKIELISEERKVSENTLLEDIRALNEKYSAATHQVRQLEAKIKEDTEKIYLLNEKISSNEAIVILSGKKTADLTSNLSDLQELFDSKLKQENFDKQRLNNLEQDILIKEHDINTLKIENTSLTAEIQKLKEQNMHYTLQFQKSSEEFEEKKRLTDDLQEKLKNLQTSLESSSSQANAYTKKLADQTAELEKKNQDLSSLTKKVESGRVEVDNLQKQISRNKEISDQLSKSLQEQINQVIDSKNSSEKKMKSEFEEKIKKEKYEQDEKHKKTMADVKEKADLISKLNAEKIKLIQDMDKQKKEVDQIKAETCKKDDLTKAQARVKALETDIIATKAEVGKAVEAMNAKLNEITKELNSKKEEVARLTESLSAIQTKHDLLMQENDVAQSNYERNLKGVTEKEEALKKLKQIKDDLAASERTLRGSMARLEKEKEILHSEIETLKMDIASKNKLIDDDKQQTNEELQKINAKVKEMESEVLAIKLERDCVTKKLEAAENERSLSERKAGQLVKDLQKQLAKQRKGGNTDEVPESRPTTSTAPFSTHGGKNSTADEVTILYQENEALIKRADMFEEELRAADEQLKRVRYELDQKSKVVQQYILRDHEAAFQPDEKPKVHKIGINILTSTAAMQKLDPVILSSINVKMQKLLEDLTIKMVAMEEELKKLKPSVQSK